MDEWVGFYQQVQVVPLHGEVNHPKPELLLAFAQCSRDGAEAATRPQARKTAAHSHRHERRHPTWLFPRSMRHSRPQTLGLPTGTFPLPAPTPKFHRELLHCISTASIERDMTVPSGSDIPLARERGGLDSANNVPKPRRHFPRARGRRRDAFRFARRWPGARRERVETARVVGGSHLTPRHASHLESANNAALVERMAHANPAKCLERGGGGWPAECAPNRVRLRRSSAAMLRRLVFMPAIHTVGTCLRRSRRSIPALSCLRAL